MIELKDGMEFKIMNLEGLNRNYVAYGDPINFFYIRKLKLNEVVKLYKNSIINKWFLVTKDKYIVPNIFEKDVLKMMNCQENKKEAKNQEQLLHKTKKDNNKNDTLQQSVKPDTSKQLTIEDIKKKNKNGGFNLWEMYFLLKEYPGWTARFNKPLKDKEKIRYYYVANDSLYYHLDINNDAWVTTDFATINSEKLNGKFIINIPKEEQEKKEEWIECDIKTAIKNFNNGYKIQFKDIDLWHDFKSDYLNNLQDFILNNSQWRYLKKEDDK